MPEGREKPAAKTDDVKKKLAASGIEEQHGVANVYVQEGIGLTLEQVIQEGIDRVVERHRQARDRKGQ